jgi:hypothetical protein
MTWQLAPYWLWTSQGQLKKAADILLVMEIHLTNKKAAHALWVKHIHMTTNNKAAFT